MNTPGIIRMSEQSIEQDRLMRLRGMIASSGGDPSSILEGLHLVISSKDWRKIIDPNDKYSGAMTVRAYIESLGWTKEELFSFVSRNKHRHEKPPFNDPGRIAQMDELRTMVMQITGETSQALGPNGVKMNDVTCDNITGDTTPEDRGTDPSYLTRRIARDRPDIIERMKAGEFPSVRAAALEAGIVQPSFQCPADPLKAAVRLRKHFSGEALTTLLTELANHASFDLTPRR